MSIPEKKLKSMSAWDLMVILRSFAFDSADNLSHAASLEKWDVVDNILCQMKAITEVDNMLKAVIKIHELKELDK